MVKILMQLTVLLVLLCTALYGCSLENSDGNVQIEAEKKVESIQEKSKKKKTEELDLIEENKELIQSQTDLDDRRSKGISVELHDVGSVN